MAELYECPKGCGRADFKTKPAAYAHAVHCKAEGGKAPDDDMKPIVDMIIPYIQEGIAGLQERVQTNIINSLGEVLPKMVAQQTESMAGQIAEQLKRNPNAGFAQIMGQANQFLETPLGKLIFNWLVQGSRGNMNDWRRGANLAVRMLGANKGDAEATAHLIKTFTEPYVGRTGNDLFRGMYQAAEMFAPSGKLPRVLEDEDLLLGKGGEK